MMPQVSIVIPVYNREGVIRRAVHSVIAQREKDWELILVDDRSTDRSLDIAREYESTTIRIFQNAVNQGAGASRNFGIQQAKGKYIALLDSDDAYDPQFLARSVKALSSAPPHIGFSYTGVGTIDINGNMSTIDRTVWRLATKFENKKKPYLYQLHIGTSTGILFRREVFDKVGFFDPALKAAEDTDFFIRASEYFRGLAIDDVLMYKDDSSVNRLTSDFSKLADAYAAMLEKNRDEIDRDNFLVRRWYTKAMWLDFYAGRRDRARKNFDALVQLRQNNLKSVLTFCGGMVLPTMAFKRLHQRMSKALE